MFLDPGFVPTQDDTLSLCATIFDRGKSPARAAIKWEQLPLGNLFIRQNAEYHPPRSVSYTHLLGYVFAWRRLDRCRTAQECACAQQNSSRKCQVYRPQHKRTWRLLGCCCQHVFRTRWGSWTGIEHCPSSYPKLLHTMKEILGDLLTVSRNLDRLQQLN